MVRLFTGINLFVSCTIMLLSGAAFAASRDISPAEVEMEERMKAMKFEKTRQEMNRKEGLEEEVKKNRDITRKRQADERKRKK